MAKYRVTVLSNNRDKGAQALQVEVDHPDDAIAEAKRKYGKDYIWQSASVDEVPSAEDAIKRANHAKNLFEANLITADEYVEELNKVRRTQGLQPLDKGTVLGNLNHALMFRLNPGCPPEGNSGRLR